NKCVQGGTGGRKTKVLAGNVAEGASRLPTAEDLRGRSATTHPRLALPERQFIDVCQLEDLRGIETRLGAVAPQDVGIVPVKAGPPVVIRPIDGLRVRVGTLNHETLRELPRDGSLEGVVIGA